MQPNITGVDVSGVRAGNITIRDVDVKLEYKVYVMYESLTKEHIDTIVLQHGDLAPELRKRIERELLVSPSEESGDDFGRHLDGLLRQAVHSLTNDAFDEDLLHQLFDETFGANSFVKTIFVGLDNLDLPLPVKYGIAQLVDYDHMRTLLRAWFVGSFDRDQAAKHFEEGALALVDVKSTVAALIEFVQLKRSEPVSHMDVDVLKAELNHVVAPYVDEEKLRSTFGNAIAVGLPENQLFVEQFVDVAKSAIISASEKL
ncbi:MAG: hypothetical protein KC546_17340 [Anaerolineae bacterium]|nr:hypothetical protein [Anaerolineae bacterium]